MCVAGMGLAIGTEIDVVAYGTLISYTSDVALTGAKRSIAVDAEVACNGRSLNSKRTIDGHESMFRVGLLGTFEAIAAVVPVRAIETLVTNTENGLHMSKQLQYDGRIEETHLITSIACCCVRHISACVAKRQHLSGDVATVGDELECMTGMVTMLVGNMTGHAKIVVITIRTSDKFTFGENWTNRSARL